MKYHSLYGHMLSEQRLKDSFKQVQVAKGAAGIDMQSLSDFARNLDVEIDNLLAELQEKTYKPLPVRRVEIPKSDGGIRLLSIPAVRDRVVQQALRSILEPIFDPDFHPSSYGYRKGKGCHQAISKASLFIRRYHLKHVVDMDLSKCFDCLDHQIILQQFGKKVADGSILNLLKLFLESGVMVGNALQATDIGSPQGGVISPLICNVYLDSFDQYMKERGHRIVRYADDILILKSTRKAATNAQQVATDYLENVLKLKVNQQKTHLTHSDKGVKFLGVVIETDYTRIQKLILKAFKEKVKSYTKRNTGLNLKEVIGKLNPVLRGFSQYFKIANCSRELKGIISWIRRRLRCIQLKQWKTYAKLQRRLRQLGYFKPFPRIKMASWCNAKSPQSSMAMPNKWLHDKLGLYDLAQVKTGVIVHQIDG